MAELMRAQAPCRTAKSLLRLFQTPVVNGFVPNIYIDHLARLCVWSSREGSDEAVYSRCDHHLVRFRHRRSDSPRPAARRHSDHLGRTDRVLERPQRARELNLQRPPTHRLRTFARRCGIGITPSNEEQANGYSERSLSENAGRDLRL